MKKYALIFAILSTLTILSCSSDKSSNTIVDSGKSDNGSNDRENVTIGKQIWMNKNLDADHYRNGEAIPEVTDPEEWANLTTGAWCYYNNDPATGAIYGKIYNWYAINDSRGLAPSGYRIPNDDDWAILINFLNGDKVAGGKMKEKGMAHWESPNKNATNESGFSALPGGYRSYMGLYGGMGTTADMWSSNGNGTFSIWDMYLHNDKSYIIKDSITKNDGLSVRCISLTVSN